MALKDQENRSESMDTGSREFPSFWEDSELRQEPEKQENQEKQEKVEERTQAGDAGGQAQPSLEQGGKTRPGARKLLIYLPAALFLTLLAFLLYFGLGRSSALEQRNALREQVAGLQQEKQRLQEENGQLSEKVEVLSAAVNQSRKEQEELELKHEPTAYPLSGTAVMEEEQDEEGNPMLVFEASGSESVLAAANGTVVSVEADETYGSRIRLDHGNGYETVYRTGGGVKVKEGDEITGGTLLAEMEKEQTKLGFQILKEGEYINPAEKLRIYG